MQQLGVTDLVLADPLIREIAQTFGRDPSPPSSRLAHEQVRLYGQVRYDAMTRLHVGMEAVRDTYSTAMGRAAESDNGPGWVDVQVERTQLVADPHGETRSQSVTVTERRFDPDAFTRWYNAQDGLANRAFAQLYGNSHTERQAPASVRGNEPAAHGPGAINRIRFDNAPWHMDGLAAPMRRDGLIGLDLNTAPRMRNDAAVGFDFEVGWATAPDNIVDKPSTTRKIAQLAVVVAVSYFTYGAVSGWAGATAAAGGLGLGVVGQAAVAGAAAAAASSVVSGAMNGNLDFKDVLRSAFSGALTAGLMQGLGNTQLMRGAGDIGRTALRMTVQGGVQALMGGKFRDGAAAGFASGLAEAVGRHLNTEFLRTLPAEQQAAAGMVTRVVTSAIRALGSPDDPLGAFASSFLQDVLQDSELAVGGMRPVVAGVANDPGHAAATLQAQALAEELMDLGYAPDDAAAEAMRRVGITLSPSSGAAGPVATVFDPRSTGAVSLAPIEINGRLLPQDRYGNRYQVDADGRTLVTMASGGVVGLQPQPLVIRNGVVQLTTALVRELAAVARNPLPLIGTLATAPGNAGPDVQRVDLGNGVAFQHQPGEVWGQKLEQNEAGQWEVVAERAVGIPTGMGFQVLTEEELALLQANNARPAAPPTPPNPPLPAWVDRVEVVPTFVAADPTPSVPGFEAAPQPSADDLIIDSRTPQQRYADALQAWRTNPQLRHPDALLGNSEGGPGQWALSGQRRKGETYQEQVTGVPRGVEYLVNGVWVDGYDATRNVLLDAKDWGAYPPANSDFWQRDVIREAERQLNAVRGTTTQIKWQVASQHAANELNTLFAQNEGLSQIKIVVVAKP